MDGILSRRIVEYGNGMHVLEIDIVSPMCDRSVGVKACVVVRAQLVVILVPGSVPQGHSLYRHFQDNCMTRIFSVFEKKEGAKASERA